MSSIFTFIGGLVAIVAAAIFKGYALSKLWSWFIVPTFTAPALTIPVAIGVAYISALLTADWRSAKSDDYTKMTASQRMAFDILSSLIVSAFALLFGRIVVAFM